MCNVGIERDYQKGFHYAGITIQYFAGDSQNDLIRLYKVKPSTLKHLEDKSQMQSESILLRMYLQIQRGMNEKTSSTSHWKLSAGIKGAAIVILDNNVASGVYIL